MKNKYNEVNGCRNESILFEILEYLMKRDEMYI